MNTVFVYAKDNKIAVLDLETAMNGKEEKLLNEGYIHTATLDPCRFIEYLCNDSKNVTVDVRCLLKKR